MYDLLQPLIHKAAVHEICVNVAKSRLSIGDSAHLVQLADGRIGVAAELAGTWLGLIPRKVTRLIGVLGPHATELIAPAVSRGELLRVRIVGLTPEYLALTPGASEVHVSVWGDPRHISSWAADGTKTTPKPLKSEAPLKPARSF
ncbi:MAG: hypothetical protein K9G71_04145 [Rhodobacteraceae bacterium]|jgi:hypothetical protein|nr:hypothetical protein [Paracoccaceae bacterium]MCF8513330.1 hypothetical protein [Paracoccaceae bacterium]MCF8517770.1 hypothetical protein [Paracoccaceae bacterium]